MSFSPSNIAILVVAGGTGTRMKSDVPKQYMTIHGQSIIRHTIEKLIPFGQVFCVIDENHMTFYEEAVRGLDLPPPAFGGQTRQESVHNGLKHIERECHPSHVLIHDAARPCFYTQDIHNVIGNLSNHSNVTLAQKITETIQKNGVPIDRDDAWIIQTPQAFPFDEVLNAHDDAVKNNMSTTDDTAIMASHGHPVHYVECGRHNLKITTQDDFKMAQTLLSQSIETRTGMGFDVHAFDNIAATSVHLCGVDIPHNRSLKGHSDADVGLHAITDAILGAIAQGDIGTHFPPSNNDFKNMDSHVFLDKSVEILKAKGGSLTHIDLTLICEEPKIGMHRETIRNHLSNHLSLSKSRISIKATTSEQLGFTGRREGVAAQAVVTVKVPSHD